MEPKECPLCGEEREWRIISDAPDAEAELIHPSTGTTLCQPEGENKVGICVECGGRVRELDNGSVFHVDSNVNGDCPADEAVEAELAEGMKQMRIVNLVDSGLLWLINKVVFHPRGYMLGAANPDDPGGPFLLMGDGSQPVVFGKDIDEGELFDRVKEFMP